MDFKIFDKRYSSRLYMWGDYDIQFRNHEAVVNEEVAYHMARTDKDDDFVIENKVVPFNKDSWTKEKRVIWGGNVSTANGFGMVAENTIKELIKLGADVYTYGGLSGNSVSGSQYVDPLVKNAIGKKINPDCIEIQHCQPPAFKNNVVARKWIYTMFETTHTPVSWIKMLNNAERIIVPSGWLVDSWREQGVTKPIDVVGHGFNPDVFYYMNRPKRDTFTFLHYGQLSARKGSDLVVRAFQEEFKGQSDVKLVVKNTVPFFPFPFDIPNVTYMSATLTKTELLKLLFNADCFVFPTRGEGFGLPPFEAMATGLPTIVTNWGGCADYTDKNDTLALSYTMRHSDEFDLIYKDYFEEGENAGDWAEPDLAHLRMLMRFAYENQEVVHNMGFAAAKRLAEGWTWGDKIKELYDIIDNASNQ